MPGSFPPQRRSQGSGHATGRVEGSVRLGACPRITWRSFCHRFSRAFAAEHPLVTVELICESSRQLIPAIQSGRIDLAIVTRLPEQTFDAQRREPLVWSLRKVTSFGETDPLPIALFEAGCGPAHSHVLGSPQSSRSGLTAWPDIEREPGGTRSVVEAGLGVAGLPRCSVPPSLRIVGEREDFLLARSWK